MQLSFSASILQEISDPQPTINSVKVEHPAYYCNSYSDQGTIISDRTTSVDAMVVSAAYCKANPLSRAINLITFVLAIPPNTTLVSSSSQAASPNALFYQHSPEQHHHQNTVKYPENGHDTLSDFVTFVCQETDSSPQSAQVSLYPNISTNL